MRELVVWGLVAFVALLGCLMCAAPMSSYYVTSPTGPVLSEIFGPVGVVRIPITFVQA